MRRWACWSGQGSEGVRDVPVELRLVDGRSGAQRTLGPFRWASVYERPTAPAPDRFTALQFHGYLAGHVSPEGVLLAWPHAFHVHRYRPDGTLELVIRDSTPRVVMDAGVRREWEERLSSYPDRLREIFTDLPHPDSLPAFDRVLEGDGRIWALHYQSGPRDWTRWSVYQGSGEHAALVSFPGTFSLQSVRGGRGYGVRRDPVGVERVEVYDLPLPPP